MGGLPDPDWYLDNVLVHAQPGIPTRIVVGPAAAWQQWWRDRVDVSEPLVQLAGEQGFVLTTRQLRAAGWRDHDLRREVRRGNWSVAGFGAASPIVVGGDDAPARRRRHALACSAAALARPGQVISGRSAAILHGLPTLAVPELPESTCSDTTLGRRSRVHVHGASLATADCTTWFGTSVTTVARTLVDVARHDRRDGLAAADAALRESLVDRAGIDAALTTAAGWPGVRRARAVLSLADPLAESALESLTRLALHHDGFPRPQLQVEIPDPRRRRPWRVDMLWPERRFVLEADGRVKYTGDEYWREKRRETRLRALGYRVERVLWEDVVYHWAQTSAWLRPLILG